MQTSKTIHYKNSENQTEALFVQYEYDDCYIGTDAEGNEGLSILKSRVLTPGPLTLVLNADTEDQTENHWSVGYGLSEIKTSPIGNRSWLSEVDFIYVAQDITEQEANALIGAK